MIKSRGEGTSLVVAEDLSVKQTGSLVGQKMVGKFLG